MTNSFIKILLIGIFIFNITFAQERGVIRGIVIDKTTKEPLPGVNLIIPDTDLGTSSDENGEYVISGLTAGNYILRASFIGYDSQIKSDIIVNSARPAFVEFQLNQSVIELEGVTVTTEFFEKNPDELISVKKFSYEEIRRAPGGFEDVIRALSVLPGVAVQSAGRNDLVVRGGSPAENLYVVDGFVVPNINHFGNQGATGGPLSYINLDFVNETTFSSGGFSTAYGDKLSSVLKIDLREGRKDKIGGKATISASQFGLNLEGPLSENSNFLFSARRSYLDFIFNAAGFNFVPEYYDVIAKFSYDIDKQSRISYLFVSAFDNVKFNNNNREDLIDNSQILGSDQISYLTGLSYRRLIKNGFYTVSLSRNFTDFDTFQKDTLLNPIFSNISREGENELKTDIVYKIGQNAEINAGVSGKLIKFNGDVYFPAGFVTTYGELLPNNRILASENFVKAGFYFQYSREMFHRLRFNTGFRVDYFDGINKNTCISPRASLAYYVSPLTTISLSAGNYRQFPSYIWLIADSRNRDLTAISVNQYIAGIEQLLREDVRVKAEFFYKDYSDYPTSILRPYIVLANTGGGFGGSQENFASFGLEPLISEGIGFSRGIELSMQKKSSGIPYYGILSATFSESYFTSLDGVSRPGQFDQKWIVNLSGGYIFDKHWEASLKFRFATGNPYTPYNDDGTQNVSDYLSERFDSQHALDIRVDRRWYFSGWSLITYIDIQNIYNRKNTNSIQWDPIEKTSEKSSSIGILPSIGISVEF